MNGRSGFSLVEMVIVLALAGVVSVAAINMFASQNRVNAVMTELGESQENARSAVEVAARDLHGASGGIGMARPNRLLARIPVTMGVICAAPSPGSRAAYFPRRSSDLVFARDVDGIGYRNATGMWITGYRTDAGGFNGRASRQPCLDAGRGAAGSDAEYATLIVDGDVGDLVMLYQEVGYRFGTSSLDPDSRALIRQRGRTQVELAHGFSRWSRFEYWIDDQNRWTPYVGGSWRRDITRVRFIAMLEGAVDGTTAPVFEVTREIFLVNIAQ